MKLLKLVPDNTNIKFLKLRIPFFVLSLVLIFGSWAAVLVNGLNFGVDFAGGQEVRMTFKERETAPIPSLRELVGGLGYGEPVVQEFGAPNQVSIRVSLPEGTENTPGAATAIGDKVIAAIAKEYPDARKDGNDTVSGKVAGEFRDQAILALLAAMAAVSVYIWIRFEWQFGVGAMFALVHDVSVTVGLFALTQMEFSLQIVAAILAIIGYSLNDTIVVYDRIRENLKKYRKMPLGELLDLSVNETLARTVMTSLTLFIALIPLLIFGPPSLFGMVAAITVGLFIGTYSSIYMAGPLLIWMGVTSTSFVPTETATDRQDKLARGEG
ncbi:protein translocase subunit SecF [Porphyrobacter sp. SLTP]|jgi:preprotein translocase subunit SecF|uniref:protein translocase subunit SecF n=1 Tax=Porphyrobacter sp. SLTP TaxID=2683266 RepID=UPI0014128592|nr:protein translocase subunit SecF [Porphyrobacter sp. SLTP]NBB23991.1 protein translocase subunit SecF [Porphyrobacter sp. SLTP]